MKGYERTPEITEQLIVALNRAIRENPTQRLGQLLMNLNRSEGRINTDLWNVYDEKWIELLAKDWD